MRSAMSRPRFRLRLVSTFRWNSVPRSSLSVANVGTSHRGRRSVSIAVTRTPACLAASAALKALASRLHSSTR
ncbi:hypothetical protein DMA12_32665 [Amycolatopsis balhimycina DSM 5908]|uniref:Uncharacterized protein n=1 Tax=Amycolatopsis balhimycina DSM 5908 TaxID=1081091 RepID=A0A428W678_AMYBA|nr:hypothetical protein DMA12_32665 [Amycolatopsis balhimycina DSM 5908]